MVHRLTRFLLPITCIVAFAAAPAVATAKVLVGISDQGTGMFSDHNFNRLNITTARYVVQWNAAVIRNKTLLHEAEAWVNAAVADHVQPLISFGGVNGTTSNAVPSTRQYAAAVKAFVRDVPKVKAYTAWDEPDWVYRPGLAKHPALAAAYFNTLIRYCHRTCTVAAGDVYLPNPSLGNWLRQYKRYLAATPAAWAIHNYYDVRSHTSGQLQTLESVAHTGQIWLTEIGGVIRRGHWQYRNQSTGAAGRDEGFLFSLPRRFHRITRIYHYQWYGTVDGPHTGWDSGLIGPQGVPRPAYWALAKFAGSRKK